MITKESREDFSQQVLFDTIFEDRRLIQYQNTLPYSVFKEVNNVLDSKYLIQAKYIIAQHDHSIQGMTGATVFGASTPVPSGSRSVEVKVDF